MKRKSMYIVFFGQVEKGQNKEEDETWPIAIVNYRKILNNIPLFVRNYVACVHCDVKPYFIH